MLRFFQNRWWIVVASLSGMLVGSGPLHLFVFNIFMKPVSAELGLSRGTLSSAVGLYGLLNAGGAIIIGWMLDRWGTRRVMIPALACYVLVTMLFSFMSSGATVFLIFGFAGLISGCQSPVPYANVVAKWFDRERGLALGLSTAGVGLGVAVLGPIAAVLIGRMAGTAPITGSPRSPSCWGSCRWRSSCATRRRSSGRSPAPAATSPRSCPA